MSDTIAATPSTTAPDLTSARAPLPGPEMAAHPEADRTPVKPPEHGGGHAQATIAPPESPLPPALPPTPPIAQVVPTGTPLASGLDDSKLIEQYLAHFIADRLPKDVARGLMLDVIIAPCNAVTGEGEEAGAHDIAITVKGGKLEDQKESKSVAEMIRAALQEHPAFSGLSFSGAGDRDISHFMRCQILALEPKRVEALRKPQPRQRTTFITPVSPSSTTPEAIAAQAAIEASTQAATGHEGHGPNCAHCNALAATPEAAPSSAPMVAQPTPDAASHPAPAQLQLQPQPPTTVEVPAAHQGLAATPPQHKISA